MNNLPLHIAIIMDGNGRWALKRGLPRTDGHIAGAKALKKTVAAALDMDIKYLTVFAFSTENFNRPKTEVDAIMALIALYCKKEIKKLLEDDIKLVFIGDKSRLDGKTAAAMEKAERLTSECGSMQLNIAVNYSGRSDILQAVNKAVEIGNSIDEESFENLLLTAGIPAPDLLVRTGGEKRISNFMLYQCAYTELVFLDKYWPDFNKKTLEKVIYEYSLRNRRFGAIGKENENA